MWVLQYLDNPMRNGSLLVDCQAKALVLVQPDILLTYGFLFVSGKLLGYAGTLSSLQSFLSTDFESCVVASALAM